MNQQKTRMRGGFVPAEPIFSVIVVTKFFIFMWFLWLHRLSSSCGYAWVIDGIMVGKLNEQCRKAGLANEQSIPLDVYGVNAT